MHLQFITNANEDWDEFQQVQRVLDGGCKWIQLRMKWASPKERLDMAERIRKITCEYGAFLVIDDDVSVALRVEADGVHLGRNDIGVGLSRKIIGESKVVGCTVNTFDDIKSLLQESVDYLGCGPYQYTKTKKGLSPVLGIDGYSAIMKKMKFDSISLPLIAIGGIRIEDIEDLARVGVQGVAMSSFILSASDISKRVQSIISI